MEEILEALHAKNLEELPEMILRHYRFYEHPEKALIGSKIYILKESQDGKGE
jgi:hypothetical protein